MKDKYNVVKKSENNSNTIKMCADGFISLDINESAHNVLIVGNTAGFFGYFRIKGNSIDLDEQITNMDVMPDRLCWLCDILENGATITIIGNNDTIRYYQELFMFFKDTDIKFNRYKQTCYKEINDDKECLQFITKIKEMNMKFDYIIENPPYKGSLHLDFLMESLDMLDEKCGKFTIIEPATWLINVRKNGKAKLYDEIKKKLEGHVSKIVIENYNKEFNINLYVPCSITYIDMTQTFNDIEFICCGHKKYVKTLYDCNLIGEYNKIWGIFDKVQKYGDIMKYHVYNEKTSKVNKNIWFCKYGEIIGHGGIGDNLIRYTWDSQYFTKYNIFQFLGLYPCISPKESISDKPLNSIKAWPSENANPIYSDKIGYNLFDTKEHLENWKHFVFNNKLPLFLNICLTIDQHNNSKEFVPWLVDRQYTDDEINQLFGFTDDEIKFMDKTIKKFERYSPWFKRYMCGKSSVSDDEIQKFIDSI